MLDAPENSLQGLRLAKEQGADGVEIDLRTSLDLEPFLMHDWTMRRVAAFPLPLELTPSFIVRRLDLKDSQEKVPSLDDALDQLLEGMLLAVDVKDPWAVVRLVREIKRRGLQSRVLIWCTSALAVRYAVRALPDAEVAYLKDVVDAEGKRRFLQKARGLGARAVSAHWRAIDSEFVAEAHALSLSVYSYHAGAALNPEKLASGLDGLITDIPKIARQAFALI
jgi:glycerophosphoryl diester phosphodiesterase